MKVLSFRMEQNPIDLKYNYFGINVCGAHWIFLPMVAGLLFSDSKLEIYWLIPHQEIS